MRTLEFGNGIESPAKGVDRKVIDDLLDFNYQITKRKAFPEFEGTYEIRTSGVQGRGYIYRLDGEPVEESVRYAYYGLDENDGYVGRAEDWVLPEGHAIGLRYYQQFAWYAQVPEDLVVPPSGQKPFTVLDY